MRRLLAVLLVMWAVPAGATTYYVSKTGTDAWPGCTQGAPCLTIDHVADRVSAGDTVRVSAGTYAEVVTPSVNGSSSSATVTFVADGTVTMCGWTFSSSSYIRVIGFTMDPSTSGCTPDATIVSVTGTNTGLEFWNNTIQNTNANAFLIDSSGSNRCDSCILLGGTAKNIGTGDTGYSAVSWTGNDGVIGYVSFEAICYIGTYTAGSRLRMINLNFSGMVQCGGTHPDFLYVAGTSQLGYSFNLFESSFGVGTITATQNKAQHLQTQSTPAVNWTDNIWRRNVVYNIGSGYYSVYSSSTYGLISRSRFYHDTVVNMSQAQNQSDPQYDAAGSLSSQAGALTASLYNNIYVNGWTEAARTSVSVSGWSANYAGTTITSNGNLLYDTRGSVTSGLPDANPQVNVNPQFVSSGTDFSLQSGSGARGTGRALTTTNESGTNSTTLILASGSGSLFVGSNASNLPQYSGGLVPGDTITVGTTTVAVSSVSGDTLTLASPISWSAGASVYFGSSATPDIGAYPYKAGGYTLSASYSIAEGTATITPNDASLVRFVVCYDSGVPIAVDNSSPYTCSVGTGTFSARVYPLYASSTLYAQAGAGAVPNAPTNVRIR